MSAQSLVEMLELMMGPLSPSVRAALEAVDRARFVRPCDRAFAYDKWPLPLDTPHGGKVPPVAELLERHGSWERALFGGEFRAAGATISSPMIYPLAFRLLELAEGHRLLELGCGTGYGAALAAHVVGPRGQVTSVDVDPYLVETARAATAELPQLTIVHDDGLVRADLVAAHDRAWLTFSVAQVPSTLVDALSEGATLLVPVGPPPPSPQRWLRFRRQAGQIAEKELPIPVQFIQSRSLISA
jgi:protein-L-isoaspartate(D-aspartate) O-methyltransferase